MDIFSKKIILASGSPRRHQLLGEAGFDFEIKNDIEVEENYSSELDIHAVPEFLAVKKSKAYRQYLDQADILITADTVVIVDGKIYGKPLDRAHAVQMIELISGRKHTVITGVSLCSKVDEINFSVSSEVDLETLSGEEIDYYIDRYAPYDKAGAYGIQEWIGLCKIKAITGTYANVMGLPMSEVYKNLIALKL